MNSSKQSFNSDSIHPARSWHSECRSTEYLCSPHSRSLHHLLPQYNPSSHLAIEIRLGSMDFFLLCPPVQTRKSELGATLRPSLGPQTPRSKRIIPKDRSTSNTCTEQRRICCISDRQILSSQSSDHRSWIEIVVRISMAKIGPCKCAQRRSRGSKRSKSCSRYHSIFCWEDIQLI